jgi:ribosomal protein L40E
MKKLFTVFALFLFSCSIYPEEHKNCVNNKYDLLPLEGNFYIGENYNGPAAVDPSLLTVVKHSKKKRHKGKEEFWICPKCGYSNPGKVVMCRNCAFPFDSEIDGY